MNSRKRVPPRMQRRCASSWSWTRVVAAARPPAADLPALASDGQTPAAAAFDAAARIGFESAFRRRRPGTTARVVDTRRRAGTARRRTRSPTPDERAGSRRRAGERGKCRRRARSRSCRRGGRSVCSRNLDPGGGRPTPEPRTPTPHARRSPLSSRPPAKHSSSTSLRPRSSSRGRRARVARFLRGHSVQLGRRVEIDPRLGGTSTSTSSIVICDNSSSAVHHPKGCATARSMRRAKAARQGEPRPGLPGRARLCAAEALGLACSPSARWRRSFRGV